MKQTPRTDALEADWFCMRHEADNEAIELFKNVRQLEQELNEAKADWKTKRDELIHKKFFFQPHPDDSAKCNCAYCARDFEAVSDHAAYMEMKLLNLHEVESERDQLRKVADELATSLQEWTDGKDAPIAVSRLKLYSQLPHVKQKEKK